MIDAKEASRLREEMPVEDRLKTLKKEVSKSTQNALDKEIRKAIASYKDKVSISLWAKVCLDPDAKIKDLLIWLWYKDVQVTSDFPGYSESYEGSTSIKFSL